MSWVKRVEAVLEVLKGSSIEEMELAEGALEIIVRRSSGNILTVAPSRPAAAVAQPSAAAPAPASRTLSMKSPLTGVYYSAPSPTSAPFINVGDIVTIGQTIAMIEAMKVFSEVPSELAGRVVAIKVHNGDVVKKGDVLFEVEPS